MLVVLSLGMKVTETHLEPSIIDTYILENGQHYFFDNFIVSEINDGIKIDYDSSKDVLDVVNSHYEDSKEVILITNCIHQNEISSNNWDKMLQDVKAIGVVSNSRYELNTNPDLPHFTTARIRNFSKLEDAIKWANEFKK